MIKDVEILIDILNNYINGKACSTVKLQDVDWEYIISEANAHNCLPLITHALSERSNELPSGVWEKMQYDSAYLGALQYQKNHELKEVLKIFNDNEIESCIFKGYAIARLYPERILRMSGDMDILISPDKMELANRLLLERGYVVDEASSKENVPVYIYKNTFVIELHSSLWEDYKGDNIDLLKEYKIDSPEYQIDFNLEGVACKTLGYTQHFVYLIYHMIKHFIPAGVGIRHFLDLTLYVNRYYNRIDLYKVRSILEEMGYYYFVCSIFRICINYLGMNEKVLGNQSITMTKVDYKVLEDILDAGVFGTKTLYRRKTTDVVRNAYYKGEGKRSSKFKMYIKVLFPAPSELSDRYVDAKKYPILLPVAWVQRMWHHLVCKIKNTDEPSVFEKTRKVEERMDMLNELKLLS